MFFKRTSGKVVLVADVEDTSVGVSIVQLSKNGSAAILISGRKSLSLEDRSADQSASGVVRLLEESTDAALKSYNTSEGKNIPPPHDVYAVLRAPWTRFRTVQAEEMYPEPRVVTKELLSSLAKKALAESSELDRNNIIEAGTLQVFVNGYPTGNPLGKKGTRLSVVACEADVNAEMKKNITAVLGKLLPGRQPVFKSSMRAVLTVLHEHIPDIHRYVILDMGGSTTTCAVIRKDAISQLAVIPEGQGTLLKRITGGGHLEDMQTQLRMLASDTCTTDACQALRDSLARAEPDLAKSFGEGFGLLATKRRLPNAAILSAPSDLLPWLQGFFARIDFAQFTATMQPFVIEPLSADHLHGVVEWVSGTPADTGITIAVGYVNIIEQSS